MALFRKKRLLRLNIVTNCVRRAVAALLRQPRVVTEELDIYLGNLHRGKPRVASPTPGIFTN